MSLDDEFYGDEVVDQWWPFDGPHGDERTSQAAVAIARLVRYLNNATGPGHCDSALPYAATAHRVVGNLAGAVDGLLQLLPQLAGFLERQADDPTLYDDRRGGPDAVPPGETARAAALHLKDSKRRAAALASGLATARRYTVHLGNEDPR